MTRGQRRQQIRKAASEAYKHVFSGQYMELAFRRGAEWADKHPDVSIAGALGYEAGRKAAIEDAAKWLKKAFVDMGLAFMQGYEVDEFVERFQKNFEI